MPRRSGSCGDGLSHQQQFVSRLAQPSLLAYPGACAQKLQVYEHMLFVACASASVCVAVTHSSNAVVLDGACECVLEEREKEDV